MGLPLRAGHVLVSEGFDATKNERFHRAIGGGIEFGETAEQALRREFDEELGLTLGHVRLLGVVENLFQFEGRPGHEIVHVFAVDGTNFAHIPLDAELRVLDEGTPIRWVPLEGATAPLYPLGTYRLLRDLQSAEASS